MFDNIIGGAVCKPVSQQDELESIVLDEIPVLNDMWRVDWSYYISCMEKINGKHR